MERARSIIAYLTDLFPTHSLDRDKYSHLVHILISVFSFNATNIGDPLSLIHAYVISVGGLQLYDEAFSRYGCYVMKTGAQSFF